MIVEGGAVIDVPVELVDRTIAWLEDEHSTDERHSRLCRGCGTLLELVQVRKGER